MHQEFWRGTQLLNSTGHHLRGFAPALEPAHVFTVLTFFAAVQLSGGPVTDIDSYWHVRLGGEIVSAYSVHGHPTSWNLTSSNGSWVTSQWLSEVVMHEAVHLGGWGALVALRLALSITLFALFSRAVLPLCTPRIGAYVFAAAAVPLAGTLQERPALASLLFLPWLARWGLAAKPLVGRRTLLLSASLVALWANLHGMWVIAPATALLVAGGAALDRDLLRAKSYLVLAAVTALAGCLSPLGPKGAVLPITFRSAAGQITEWQTTQPWSWYVLGLGMLWCAVVICWARANASVAPSEILWVLAWSLFALLAARNVVVSAVMLAPVVAVRMDTTWSPGRARTTARERTILAAAMALSTVLIGAYTVTSWAHIQPLSRTRPIAIAHWLSTYSGSERIFNAYNASGVLLEFGGPRVRLAIDGRADRWGNEVITRHLDAEARTGQWRRTLAAARPDFAVLGTGSPLADELATDQHWPVVLRDHGYVLLRHP